MKASAAKRPRPQVEPWNRDQEAMNAAAGETQFWVLFNDAQVRELIAGTVSEELRERLESSLELAPTVKEG